MTSETSGTRHLGAAGTVQRQGSEVPTATGTVLRVLFPQCELITVDHGLFSDIARKQQDVAARGSPLAPAAAGEAARSAGSACHTTEPSACRSACSKPQGWSYPCIVTIPMSFLQIRSLPSRLPLAHPHLPQPAAPAGRGQHWATGVSRT